MPYLNRGVGRGFHLHTKLGQSFVISKFRDGNFLKNEFQTPDIRARFSQFGKRGKGSCAVVEELFLNQAQLLHVNSLHHLFAVGD